MLNALLLAAVVELTAILPLTGYGAFIGRAQSEALDAVERYVNQTGGIRGETLRFVKLDSQSSPQVDIQLAQAAMAKHPPAIIEGGPATVCHAAATLYTNGPVMSCLSPAFFPERGSYAFSAGVESRIGIAVTLRYLQSAGLKRIGIVTVTDIAGQEADAAFKAFFAQPIYRDLSVVAWEHFGPSEISVDAQMARIKQAQPQVVIGWATGAPTATILRSFKTAGMTVPFVASQANQSWQQMEQYKTILPQQYLMYSSLWAAYDSLPPGPLKDGMTPYFRAMAASGIKLGGTSPLAWDSAMLLVRALRALGPGASAAQVRDYLLGVHDYDGPSGAFDFRMGNQRGIGLSDAVMVRWDAATSSWKAVSAPGGMALKGAGRGHA